MINIYINHPSNEPPEITVSEQKPVGPDFEIQYEENPSPIEWLESMKQILVAEGIEDGWLDTATSNGQTYTRLRKSENGKTTSKNLKPYEVATIEAKIERAHVVRAISLLVNYFERNSDLLNSDNNPI